MKSAAVFAVLLSAAPLVASSRGSTSAIDASGNVWTTGAITFILTTPTAFQMTASEQSCGTQTISPFGPTTSIDCAHAYLVKHDHDGKVLYATYLAGASQDGGTAITTDAQGNVYVAGYTYSSDFPVSKGAAQPKNNGPVQPIVYILGGFPFGPAFVAPGGDAFVAKFAPDGTLIFSTLLGGSGSDIPLLIGVDASGSVYVAGYTNSSDFPLAGGGITQQRAATFFARLNATGTAIVYSTYSADSILAFDVDPQGLAYLTGSGSPPSAGPYLAVIDTSAGVVVRSTFLSSLVPTVSGAGVAIALDSLRQNLFLGISPAPQPYSQFVQTQPVHPLGASNLLVLPADTSRVLAEVDMAQTQFDAILFDASGNAYAFGHGTGAIPATPVQLLAAPCSPNGGSFVLELNSAGAVLTATYFRQGGDTTVSVPSPGHILLYRLQPVVTLTSTIVAMDISAQPVANFSCPQNLASGIAGPGLAQLEIFVLTGAGLGPAQGIGAVPDASGQYPKTLGGVQVMIGSEAAPLLYVQENEIHAIATVGEPNIPDIHVQYGNQSALPLDAWPVRYNPGIFSIGGQGAVINQDGTVNAPSNPAKLGSTVSVYCTGTGYLEMPVPDGQVAPIPPPLISTATPAPQVTFAGVPGTTLWSGAAPGLVFGVTQINVRLPNALPAGTVLNAVPMVLNTEGVLSPAASISIVQ
jgi:uncharacterized protein (TIGR03437 family)